MPLIIFILILVAIWLIILFIVYVLVPLSAFLLVASLVIGLSYAFIISINSFIKSLTKHISPYTTFVDKNPDVPKGVRRSYFFGPGYHQINITVRDAFSSQEAHLNKLENFKNRHTSGTWFLDVWVLIFYIAALLCTFIFGFIWMVLFSTILSIIIFVGMCIFYIMFALLWGSDRLILALKSIQSRCSNCKRISIVPVFMCPDCGAKHKKLTPGPYGIFRRKCGCNKRLPTTFINGRSKLKASCPHCEIELATSSARQFGIQLVGGVSAGKTSFIAAFWHFYLERIRNFHNVTYETNPAEAFDELERWYQQGLSSSTTETNANMYSIVHKRDNETPYQVAIYDIAGEAFSELGSDIQQQQFKYCEGLIFVLDPTATSRSVNETFSSFINEFKALRGKHSSKTSDIPVSVIISKADLYKKEIGLPKIKARYNLSPSGFSNSDGQTCLAFARNAICQEFMRNRDFESVLNLIDGEFNNVQYFPVSAMGHSAVLGQPYEPWGVEEPVLWLLTYADKSFNETIASINSNSDKKTIRPFIKRILGEFAGILTSCMILLQVFI